MRINIFPWTSMLDKEDPMPMYAIALCADTIVLGFVVAFCWLWIPMLVIYLTTKLIRKVVAR